MSALVQDPWGRPTQVREGMHVIRVIGPEGDVKVLYEPASQEQVDEIANRIRDLHAKGFRAFGFMAGETTGELLRQDIGAGVAEYERVVVAPPMAGG